MQDGKLIAIEILLRPMGNSTRKIGVWVGFLLDFNMLK